MLKGIMNVHKIMKLLSIDNTIQEIKRNFTKLNRSQHKYGHAFVLQYKSNLLYYKTFKHGQNGKPPPPP